MLQSQIKPMEPKSFLRPFNSDRHAFQVKWDGVRILAFIEENGVRLQNRKLSSRTIQYPEMQSLKKQLKGKNAILDGEMIALLNGRPNFSRILQRDLVTNPERVQTVSRIEVVFMVFDILYLNGKNLTKKSWAQRSEILENSLVPSDSVKIVESFFQDGKRIYQAITGQDLEGMVAKEMDSPYYIGEKHRSWLKIKPRKDMICVIGGLYMESNRIKSLLVGAYRDKKLFCLGRAATGISWEDLQKLEKQLPILLSEQSPFSAPFPRGKNYRWLKPVLTVKIEYMELTDGLQLRQPVIKGFTSSDPEECILP